MDLNASYQLETGLTRRFIVSAGETPSRERGCVSLAKGHHRGHFVCPQERNSRGAWVCLIYSKGTPEGPMLFFCLLKGHPRGTERQLIGHFIALIFSGKAAQSTITRKAPKELCVLSEVNTPQRALCCVASSGGCLFQHVGITSSGLYLTGKQSSAFSPCQGHSLPHQIQTHSLRLFVFIFQICLWGRGNFLSLLPTCQGQRPHPDLGG